MESSQLPKILMFGWEFPPHNSGGLGVACQGLVGGLASLGARITFVLPKKLDYNNSNCEFIFGDQLANKLGIKIVSINSGISPYLTSEAYEEILGKNFAPKIWARDLIAEVMRYAIVAKEVAQRADFDVIHCHDWLSLPAGLAAKKATGKPLVFQVHAIEYDRVNEHCVNPDICQIEKQGLAQADVVVAVSDYTKRRIVDCYQINPDKIYVAPNAVDHAKFNAGMIDDISNLKKHNKKIALFVGRITFQKGPDYFLAAAKKVSQIDPDILFIFSGAGDMERYLIDQAARLGIADKVIFSGFMRDNDLVRLYRMADLYVMPSVSEPFGITSLEALASGTSILVSRQSGVSEMVAHCLKVDFWDVDQMANKILAVLSYPELKETLRENGFAEVKKFNWLDTAQKCLNIYQQILTT